MSTTLKEAVATFSEKFGFLLGSGVPLVPALETILAETDELRLQEVLRRVLAAIADGTRFGDALAAFPDVFSPSFLSMAQAAEQQGTLDTMMGKIAHGVRAGLIPIGGPVVDPADPTGAATRAALDRLLDTAVVRGASDLHLVPVPTGLAAACRVEGKLVDLETFPMAMREPMIDQVKRLAHLDLGEKWLTQDGRMVLTIAGRTVDARVNCLPVALGEKLTITLLSQEPFQVDLGQIFPDPAERQAFLDLLSVPSGLVVIAGPSGSGKTTTAYAALKVLRERGLAVTAIEPTIGMIVEGVAQAPVRPHLGMTYGQLLDAAERTDADALYVGDIPDAGVMGKVLKSALNGRLVIVHLHATSVADAVRRLLALNAPPHLLASALSGVVVQRLVRKVCPTCARDAKVKKNDLQTLGWAGGTLKAREGQGCESCNRSGYRGRLALYEIFAADKPFKDALAQADAAAVGGLVRPSLARPLPQAGAARIADGTTTLAEVRRVLRDYEP